MLDRVVTDEIEVRREVGFVADAVLPEASLPDAALVLLGAVGGDALDLRQCLGEGGFDLPPAGALVAVPGGQLPEAVEVLGQNDHGADGEEVGLAHVAEGVAQEL
jgi:hypothetical protein